MKTNKTTGIWFTIYADLITNLMLFFMAAFILTRVDHETQLKVNNTFRKEISGKTSPASVRHDIAKEMKESTADTFSKLEINEKRIKITMQGEVLFASGSSAVNENMKRNLDEIASVIKKTNDPVLVEGFTDDVPIHGGSNWELSLARAVSVVDYFVASANMPQTQFMVAGYGEYKPVVPNTSDENRSRNRRIELTIIRHE
jgi:chemotaxis protein MotB